MWFHNASESINSGNCRTKKVYANAIQKPYMIFFHQREATTTLLFKSILLVSKKHTKPSTWPGVSAVFERFLLVVEKPSLLTNLTTGWRFSPRKRWTGLQVQINIFGGRAAIRNLKVGSPPGAEWNARDVGPGPKKSQGDWGVPYYQRWPVFSMGKSGVKN